MCRNLLQSRADSRGDGTCYLFREMRPDISSCVLFAPYRHLHKEPSQIDMLQMSLDKVAFIVSDREAQYHRTIQLAEQNGHNAAARLLKSRRASVPLSPSAV
jgi:hypothetical protein